MSGAGSIRVEALAKGFGGRPVLRDVSLRVAPGELVAVLGASGAGKTTLFRCLARLVAPDAGEVHVAGHAMHALKGRRLAAARRDVGVVFQQFNLIRRRSALDNVLVGRLAATPLWRVALGRFTPAHVEAARSALARVGLADQAHQRADSLSGGQQQRVAIARALVQRSRVLLADEPVASLDPASAERVLSLLKALARDDGLAILCNLHQVDLAQRFADRVVGLKNGRLVERGAAPEPALTVPRR